MNQYFLVTIQGRAMPAFTAIPGVIRQTLYTEWPEAGEAYFLVETFNQIDYTGSNDIMSDLLDYRNGGCYTLRVEQLTEFDYVDKMRRSWH